MDEIVDVKPRTPKQKLKRVGLEFRMIFKRRWFAFIRSYGMFLFMSLFSFVFTILTGIISILIFNSSNEVKTHPLNWSEVKGDSKYFAYYASNPSAVLYPDLVDQIEKESGLVSVKFDTIQNMMDTIHSTDDHYAFGISLDNFNIYALTGTIYYNSSVGNQETYKSSIAAEFSRIWFHQSGKLQQVDRSFDVDYKPLNSGLSSARLWSYFGPLLMSFAIADLAPQFTVLLVEDREMGRLYALETAGLRSSIYWAGNYIFDLIWYIIVNVINWAILYAFNTPALTKNNWSGAFFAFVFTAPHTLSLVYWISLFFNKHGEASSMILYITIIVIIVPYFIITLALQNEISDPAALGTSVVPSYAFQHALSFGASRAIGKPLDARETWTGMYVKTYAVQLGSSIIFGILAYITQLVKGCVHGRKAEDIVRDRSHIDEDVEVLEAEIDSGAHDDDCILVKHLDKVYVDSTNRAFKAVNDVSLYVKEQEIFGVLGANGAGKSTLMSVITGRTDITSGSVSIFGHKITSAAAAQQFVSVCPQFDTHLFPDMTPIQHFEIYGLLKGYEGEELKREIAEYEDLMGLARYRKKLVRELSEGNARKLSVALAFLGKAPIVFLDEPTASLDPVARLQAQELIERKAPGRTLLLCTHLLSEAERLCHRLCIMLTGSLHAVGTHQHLSEKFGTKWKVELGLDNDSAECREKAARFMGEKFPGAELAGERFASMTYNIPSNGVQLPQVFIILTEGKGEENGYTFFTCSSSTLERVFIDLVVATEKFE